MSRRGDGSRRASGLRIGIVGYGLDRPGTGISRYAIEMLRALRERHPDIEPVVLLPFGTRPSELADIGETVRLRGTGLLPMMMVIGPAQLELAIRRYRLDILHDPMGIAPFIVPQRLASVPRIATIHDAVPFVYPETQTALTRVLFHRYLPVALRRTDRIVTISEASCRDLVRYFRLPPERMAVIPLGVSTRFRPSAPSEIDQALARYQIEPPYLLAVGSLEPRKNLPALFEAYHRLRSQGLPHRLVIVGKKAWKSAGIFRRLRDLRLEETVIVTGYVDDADLPRLYSGATCFVFPSLYEGFGLPPLEAMACGTPVVTSNTSSLPEVVGDAGIMVDPDDITALANAIRRVIEDPSHADQLRARGLARAQLLSWSRSADNHAALYRSVVEHP